MRHKFVLKATKSEKILPSFFKAGQKVIKLFFWSFNTHKSSKVFHTVRNLPYPETGGRKPTHLTSGNIHISHRQKPSAQYHEAKNTDVSRKYTDVSRVVFHPLPGNTRLSCKCKFDKIGQWQQQSGKTLASTSQG